MKRIRVWGFLLLTLLIAVPYLTGRAAPPWGGFVLERVSVGNDESQGNALAMAGSLTTGGLYVAFESEADNLVVGDTNSSRDVFVRGMQSGTTERVSVSSTGTEANHGGGGADISADGQFVLFTSSSTNLVANDTTISTDIYLRDRVNTTTTLISEGMGGDAADGASNSAMLSPDGGVVVYRSDADDLVAGDTNGWYDCFFENFTSGARVRVVADSGDELNAECNTPDVSDGIRRVVFASEATNVVAGDTNGVSDIFVFRPGNGNVRRVSVGSAGVEGNFESSQPSLSESGLFIAFMSRATNLVPGDTNNAADIFIHDLTTNETRLVSVNSDGDQANGQSIMPFISEDGRYVLFSSVAANLPGGTPGRYQVFMHDTLTGVTELISKDAGGTAGNDSSLNAALSGNNQMVVFESLASNLVPNDTNDVSDVFRSDIGVFPPPTATPTATQIPTASVIPTSTATRTPRPPTSTPTLDPTEFPPTATPTGTRIPPTSTPTPTPNPTEFPPTLTPTGTLTPPTNTPTPTLDPTEFPPTLTPTGTLTPATGTPTSTPDPTEFPPPATPTLDPTEFPATPTPQGTVIPLSHLLYLPLVQ